MGFLKGIKWLIDTKNAISRMSCVSGISQKMNGGPLKMTWHVTDTISKNSKSSKNALLEGFKTSNKKINK